MALSDTRSLFHLLNLPFEPFCFKGLAATADELGEKMPTVVDSVELLDLDSVSLIVLFSLRTEN